jgi:hypothetical protein
MDTFDKQKATNQDELASLLKTLTVDQIRFIVARQDCSSDAEAARVIGINKGTVSRWGDPVQRAVVLMALDGVHIAQELLRRALNEAVQVKIDGLRSRNEHVRQDVSTEIIDRNMGKPTQRQEITGADGEALTIKTVGFDMNDI